MTIKEYVAARKIAMRDEISKTGKIPHFVVIQANDNPASDAYIRGKLKDAAEIGAEAELRKFSPDISEAELLEEIAKANLDSSVDGLIVQLPLPKQISEERIKLAVDPKKDIDGFHPLGSFDPCTPKGIVDYLSAEGFNFKGKNAVVLGRSNIVGKPMAKMLLKKDCNVTVLHSKTSEEDKKFYLAHADLIVVAIGGCGYLDGHYQYKKDAIIVDVGINRGEDGKLHGDAVPNLPVAIQTPVPGGVGLLTRIALMDNLLLAFKSGKAL